MADSQSTHASAALMEPIDVIEKTPRNVWLTGLYFFDPHREGFLGFTVEGDRRRFLERTEPGVLVVIYGTTKSSREDRQKIIGLLQLSDRTGYARFFMSDDRWEEKEKNSEDKRWNYAIEAVRAWKTIPESRMSVKEFAGDTYRRKGGRQISRRGARLELHEARRILDLDLYEVDVYGQQKVGFSAVGAAKDVLTPSRAGPVSQSPYIVGEAEGRKHLYILKLMGDADAFLCEHAHGRIIVKVGFSASPERRCDDYNRTLPQGAFHWTIHKTTFGESYAPFPSSGYALAGEQAMKDSLDRSGKSLGGEFFLAGPVEIEDAWRRGVAAAKK